MAEASESTSTATQASEPARQQSTAAHGGKHVHHGRTPAAWTGSGFAIAGFILGGIALVIGPNWVLFTIAVVLCVIGAVAAAVLQRMGYGAD
ncbi:MAG TPA: HGxxPAAW family protein [Propionibacteriaceae bacterium]|nr:HGxxPAAW family protein [Propionibacteriaceae bacterium]